MLNNLIKSITSLPLKNRYHVNNIMCGFADIYAPTASQAAEVISLDDGALDVTVIKAEVDEGVAIIYQHYKTAVQTQIRIDTDFFLLLIPITGALEIATQQQRLMANAEQGIIFSPSAGDQRVAQSGTRLLTIKVGRQQLENYLSEELAGAVAEALEFSAHVALEADQFDEVFRLLSFMTASLANSGRSHYSPRARKNMVELLLNILLASLDNNYSQKLLCLPGKTIPVHVEKAISFMRKNVCNKIDVNSIVSASEVGKKLLYKSFKEYFSSTPMRYLKELRLTKVHHRLLQEQAASFSITELAYQYGFNHMGNFGADYKKRFAETPRETLNKSG